MSICKFVNSTKGKILGRTKFVVNSLGVTGGFDVFTTSNPVNKYNITLMFRERDGFTEQEKTFIKQAAGYWAEVLKDTVLPSVSWNQPIYSFKDEAFINVPLQDFSTTGTVIILEKLNDPNSSTLAFASQNVVRDAPGQFYDRFTHIGNYVTNIAFLDYALTPTYSEVEPAYFWIALHEIAHLLGISYTHWNVLDDENLLKLKRSFYVAANPVDTFPTTNIFYTTLTGDGSRTDVSYFQEFVSQGGPLAGGYYAYNSMYSPPESNSYAVSAYNEIFSAANGIMVSAIPLERNMGIGSYGSHWHEGDSSYEVEDFFSVDDRTYWGNPINSLGIELMSPVSELTDVPCPASKITLGALRDLGWTVDFSKAHTFNPFVHILSGTVYEPKIRICSYDKWSNVDENIAYENLKRNQTYKFINNSEATSITVEYDYSPLNVTQNGNEYSFVAPSNIVNFTTSLKVKMHFGSVTKTMNWIIS